MVWACQLWLTRLLWQHQKWRHYEPGGQTMWGKQQRGKQQTEIQKECQWEDKEQLKFCCEKYPTCMMIVYTKYHYHWCFHQKGSAYNVTSSIYMLIHTAVVFRYLQDISFHLTSHTDVYLKSSFLTLPKEFYCHSSIFRFCVTTFSQTLSFWFFSHYSILNTATKTAFYTENWESNSLPGCIPLPQTKI